MYSSYYAHVHSNRQKPMNMSKKKKNRIHLTLQKGQRCTSSSQNLESKYNFDLNLHWMMILRYTYGGTSSSGNGLTISEQQNSVIYLDM